MFLLEREAGTCLAQQCVEQALMMIVRRLLAVGREEMLAEWFSFEKEKVKVYYCIKNTVVLFPFTY